MEDIMNAFYCCIIMHNTAVVDRVWSGEGIESELLYDCIYDKMVLQARQRNEVESLAMHCVQMEEEGVAQ
jgi:hypothetical protein